jgi:hypothetical protein
MINIDEYRADLIENIQLDFIGKSIPPENAFFERTTATLSYVGDLGKDIFEGFYNEFVFYGFSFSIETNTLQIITQIYDGGDVIRNLTKSEVESSFKKLERVISFIKEKKYKNLEETSEFYDCCSEIYEYFYKNEINYINVVLISDLTLPKSLYQIDNKIVNEIEYSYSIFDIDYLFQIHKNGSQFSSFYIDTNLACLTVNENNNDYVSYLSVISGNELFSIYKKYKAKLLEENVRTFLQFRGDVNKGIKNTIDKSPSFFFAYNNGITATATSVEVSNNTITKIENLQIVNGGQTTASIFAAHEKFKLCLDEINVPMKLSVVKKKELHSEFVNKVAMYANTQNKVNNSDFQSNSKYHIDMKKASEKEWVKRISGSQVGSKWYYERVRGEYLNNQSYLSKSELRKFLTEYPKIQYIDKLDLGKSENAWLLRPYFTSLGAQGSFIKFSDYIKEEIEKNENLVTGHYFREVISRLILSRKIEKIISGASWYTGGFRAQTVAYTLSMFSYIINYKLKKIFNFEIIWNSQSIDVDLEIELFKLANKVHEKLIMPNGKYGNVSVWAKKKDCWEWVNKINTDTINIPDYYFLNKEEKIELLKNSKDEKVFNDTIDKLTMVFKEPYTTWYNLKEIFRDSPMSDFERRTLDKYSVKNSHYPTTNEVTILYKLLKKASTEGYKY